MEKKVQFNEQNEVADAVTNYDRTIHKPWVRMTPESRSAIIDELDNFKMTEMVVHEDSHHLTKVLTKTVEILSEIDNEKGVFDVLTVPKGGDCLFASIGSLLEIESTDIRQQVVRYVASADNWHRFEDDVKAVLVDQIPQGKISSRRYSSYMMKDGNFGTNCELVAAAEIFGFSAHVFQQNSVYFNLYEIGKYVRGMPRLHFLSTGPACLGRYRPLKPSITPSIMRLGTYTIKTRGWNTSIKYEKKADIANVRQPNVNEGELPTEPEVVARLEGDEEGVLDSDAEGHAEDDHVESDDDHAESDDDHVETDDENNEGEIQTSAEELVSHLFSLSSNPVDYVGKRRSLRYWTAVILARNGEKLTQRVIAAKYGIQRTTIQSNLKLEPAAAQYRDAKKQKEPTTAEDIVTHLARPELEVEKTEVTYSLRLYLSIFKMNIQKMTRSLRELERVFGIPFKSIQREARSDSTPSSKSYR